MVYKAASGERGLRVDGGLTPVVVARALTTEAAVVLGDEHLRRLARHAAIDDEYGTGTQVALAEARNAAAPAMSSRVPRHPSGQASM